MRWIIGAASVGLVWSGLACSEPAVSAVTYQRQSLPGVTFDAAYAAGERALAERFRVTDRDREAGTIGGEDRTAVIQADGSRVLSDAAGTPRRARRIAELRVRSEGSDTEVYCRVFLQENQSGAVRMMTSEHRGEDQPFETPADRDASTTEQQNAVWRNRSRDRVMERQILESVREIVGKPAAG